MKMKHYTAPDMRQALRQVREAQGPDAVILSSRRTQEGVEVVAAVDYDTDIADGPMGSAAGYGREHANTSVPARPQVAKPAAFSAALSQVQAEPVVTRAAPSRAAAAVDDFSAFARDTGRANLDVSDHQPDVNEELRSLRRMLETQLATLAWNDLTRRAPMQTELLKQLSALGLGHDLCTELVTQMPARVELSEAHRLSLALISRRIEVTDERWLETGGVVAFVGPTGVGKTTLLAKLAARWVLRHGPRDLALISTDCIRIGAQEQIHTLGRLLGAPAYAVEGAEQLADVLDQLGDRRLILIDTAGLSQRDTNLASELTALVAASDRMETCLVLSGAAQAGAIEESFEKFAPARPATCVLTKLDEATSLGGAISALVRSKLPLAYLSNGQRVPEDLSPARAHQLVARAVELSRKAGANADEDLLRRRFGSVAHALA